MKYNNILGVDTDMMGRDQRSNCINVLLKFKTFVGQAIRNLHGHKQKF